MSALIIMIFSTSTIAQFPKYIPRLKQTPEEIKDFISRSDGKVLQESPYKNNEGDNMYYITSSIDEVFHEFFFEDNKLQVFIMYSTATPKQHSALLSMFLPKINGGFRHYDATVFVESVPTDVPNHLLKYSSQTTYFNVKWIEKNKKYGRKLGKNN